MSITPASDIPLSVDYTSRDYYSLREEMIARVQDRLPAWTASDPSDFGVALVEAFAYMGDLMSYYIDRNMNEAFITTATQRDSVLNLAQTYGYIPAGYRSANVTLSFFNSSASVVTVPEGTVVSGDVVIGDVVETIYFTTSAPAVCDPAVLSGEAEVISTSGRAITLVSSSANTYGELIGISTGKAGQLWELLETPVVDGSVSVYVGSGADFSKWTQVTHMIDYGPYDQVFTATTDASGIVFITFGDGVSGQIPTNGYEIRALYSVGGGGISNVSPLTLTSIVYIPGYTHTDLVSFQSIVTVTNLSAAIGGSDPEALDQIRYSAPLALRANNRAVSLEDFRSLALQVGNVGKANPYASVWTSVTIYIAPTRTATDSDLAPGLDSMGAPTLEYTALAANVTEFLSDKTLLGTTVSIQPPVYADVVVDITYTKQPQYTDAEIQAAIQNKMVTEFGYINNYFQQTIYPQDVEYVLQQVTGVKNAYLTLLHRVAGSGVTTLVGAANEIFRFQESNTSVSPA